MLSFAAVPRDAVPLKPAWSTLLASLRFARHGWWQFGNATAVLRCLERAPRLRRADSGAADALRLRFDLAHWHRAFARGAGTAREIGIIADDGSPIASLHLEQADAAIDELIWRLIDDRAVVPDAPVAPVADADRSADELALATSREGFDAVVRRRRLARNDALALAGPTIARRLAPSVLPRALAAAQAAGLTLRMHVDNTGGTATWIPERVVVDANARRVTLRADDIDVVVPSAAAAVWAVALQTPDACCPAIESATAGERGFVRIDVADPSDAACEAWRRICATLAEA